MHVSTLSCACLTVLWPLQMKLKKEASIFFALSRNQPSPSPQSMAGAKRNTADAASSASSPAAMANRSAPQAATRARVSPCGATANECNCMQCMRLCATRSLMTVPTSTLSCHTTSAIAAPPKHNQRATSGQQPGGGWGEGVPSDGRRPAHAPSMFRPWTPYASLGRYGAVN